MATNLWGALFMSESEINIGGNKRKRRSLILAIIAFLAIIAASLFYTVLGGTPKLKAESLNAKETSISWRAVRNAELYNIFRMDESSGEYKKISTIKENKFTDSNLKPKNTYWYKVAVIKNGKEEKLSSFVKVTTKSLPATPSQISVEAVTFDTVEVKWNAAKETQKYCIYRADGDKGTYNKIGESKSNTFNDSKLISTTKYKYKITAMDKNGESEDSSIGETTTKEKINDRGNTGNNLINMGLAAEQGDWIYFASKSGYNSLYKMRKDGTSIKKLYDGYMGSINVLGDWVYFSNAYKLCKIKTDGSEYTQIGNESIMNFSIIGNWVYFNVYEGIFKMKTDGSEKVKLSNDNISQFNIEGDWIYYSNISDHMGLYKIKTDGSNRVKLVGDNCASINLLGDWIYYKNFSDDGKVYKIKSDGTCKEKIFNYVVNMFNVVGDNIVYEYWGYGGRLFKAGIDGKGEMQLSGSHYNYINIVGNNIFCYDFDFDTRNIFILNLKDDGVDLNKVIKSSM